MYFLSHSELPETVGLKPDTSVRIKIERGELPELRFVPSSAGQEKEPIEVQIRGNDLVILGPNNAELVLEDYVLFCEQKGCSAVESLMLPANFKDSENRDSVKDVRGEEFSVEAVTTAVTSLLIEPLILVPPAANLQSKPVLEVILSRLESESSNSQATDGALGTEGNSNPIIGGRADFIERDVERPSIEISSNTANLIAGQTATISFELSEPSTNFTLADIQVQGGALSKFTGSGTSYSATFMPSANYAGPASIAVASDAFTDAAGNNNADGADANNSVGLAVDTLLPTIEISSNATNLIAGQTATISFELSEPSTNFTLADIQVQGGALSNFTGSGTSYSATFTPSANYAGPASIAVASNAFTDAAGNSNTDGVDANNSVDLAVDTMQPTIEISSNTATLIAGQTATISFELSEASTSFTLADVQVQGGSLSNFTGSGTSYSATFTPSANYVGPASIALASDVFTDAAGNSNADGADVNNSVGLAVDTILPTIEISSNTATLIAGQTATISFELSEASTSFTLAEVQVQGGSLSNFTGSGTSYSATFTPSANYAGPASIAVASNAFTDAAGNSNADGADANNSVGLAVDTLLPTIEISSNTNLLPLGQTATISFELSEPSSDFTLADIQVQGGSLSNFTGSGTSYSATFTANVNFVGTASIVVANNVFTNNTGNSNADGMDANNTATLTVLPGPVELADVVNGIGGFAINGVNAFDSSGFSVSAAGDVNGDGLGDLMVGAFAADPNGSSSGQSYVVFGKADGTMVELADVVNGIGGFAINGANTGDRSSFSVSTAGDVNGDGLADLIVGAEYADPNGTNSGQSYVVFGKANGATVELSDIIAGVGGFAMNAIKASDYSGRSVSSAGDVNGDGLADLIVAAYYADPNGSRSGQSYVVFGKADGTTVELADVVNGIGGFAINGVNSYDRSGQCVSAAGDVNGDGLADLIVGSSSADPNGSSSGQSYVVFGKADGTVVQLADVVNGLGGFAINGANSYDQSSFSVSTAGDVNGDGLADLIVGAEYADPNGTNSGQSYVVFGKANGTTVELGDIIAGVGGFAMNAITAFDFSGRSVSSAGDVNGDGLADLIVAAYFADPNGSNSGQSYVVFGKADGTAVELADVVNGIGGFAINGANASDFSGQSVSAAGDVNGDGLADLIVGSSRADPNGTSSGQSYVIFGSTEGIFSAREVDYLGSNSDDVHAASATGQTLVGGAGNDTLSANGATILYGGAGDDTLVVDAGMITALQSNLGAGGNTGILARIDGGTGIDTLSLNGANQALDLTLIANQAGGDPLGGSRIDSIEVIDLTGTGNNSLRFTVQDVLDMGGFNTFETTGRKQLRIEGNAGDSAAFADSANWSLTGTSDQGGTTYHVYQHDSSLATVYMAENVNPVL